MKKLKIIIVAIVIICTVLSILYLSFIAEQMEKYTFSSSGGDKYFLIFTSSTNVLNSGKNLDKLITYTKQSLEDAGYDAEVVNTGNNIEKGLRESMKKNRKYILIDINTTKLLTSPNSVILRVGNNNNSKYNENLEYAKMVKGSTKELKTLIISDTRNNYYQDVAFKALRIEFSENTDYDEAEQCISKILKPVIQ